MPDFPNLTYGPTYSTTGDEMPRADDIRAYIDPTRLQKAYSIATESWTPADRWKISSSLNSMITQMDLDKFARKIYEIITEHIALDIDEEEFLEIINE